MNKTFLKLNSLIYSFTCAGLERDVVEEIIKNYAFSVYNKPRAKAFRKHFIETAMRWYDSNRQMYPQRWKQKWKNSKTFLT